MIYTELTKEAMRTAYAAHRKKYDKAGIQYVMHPLHVAERMNTEIETCVALLHDVFEDCEQKYIDHIRARFPQDVIDAIDLLTNKGKMRYVDYINKIKSSGNQVAIKVKIVDLQHNSDLSRLNTITDKDIKRTEKYKQSIHVLIS